MGRPETIRQGKDSRTVSFWLTKDAHKEFQKFIVYNGYTVSSYLRKFIKDTICNNKAGWK